MSNPNNMISNPYKVELHLNNLIKDRNLWRFGKKYTDLNLPEFNSRMKEEYSYLATSSPMLFEKAISGFMDNQNNLNMITNMLKLLKDIYDGKKKQEDVDKSLGKVLADKYIAPVIDKLDKNK